MKLTIAELDKQAKERLAKKEELEKKIVDLEQREASAKEKAQEAAEAGDLVAYKASSTEAQDLGTELIVAKAHFKRLGSGDAIVTQEEADSAWKDYTEGYNKKFDKIYSALEEKRAAMLDLIRELIDLQEEAFANRERLAKYAGINPKCYTVLDKPLDAPFPCRCLPDIPGKGEKMRMNGILTANSDVLYFLACLAEKHSLAGVGFVTSPEISRIKNIIERHSARPY